MKTHAPAAFLLKPAHKEFYNREGYLIVRQLFSRDEVVAIRRRFDEISDGKPIPGYWEPDGTPSAAGDPLKRFPRVMMPHRYDDLSRRALLDPRVREVLRELLAAEPIAVQSMFYFKPPGARGQAMHQDNFYLQVKPQTCIAAWTAIDPATPQNGGMYIVPRTQDLDVVCPEMADEKESFTTHLVGIPKGLKAIPAEMEPGDTLFFNGSVIHGSGPNRSKVTWRRAFICHYMARDSTNVSRFYHPILNFEGQVVDCPSTDDGGPCGKEFGASQHASYGKWH